MAQTQTAPRGRPLSAPQETDTRERGRPMSAPQEAPTGNAVATTGRPRGQAAPQQQAPANGAGTRGMSQSQRSELAVSNLTSVALRFREEVEGWIATLMDSAPQQEVNFFKQVLLTAVAEKPELYFADRRTLFTAARKCFLDGCLPDGRDAALVVYPGTRIKVRGPDGVDSEFRIDAVQYMPMVRGITRRMLESGLVTSAHAEAVYKNDQFERGLGDNAFIAHKPPPLGTDRGELVGAYAIIRLANGDILRDVMDSREIMAAKAKSKAAKGGGSLLWDEFPWEAYKKTVLRRLSKSAPVSPNIKRLVDRDEEAIEGEFEHTGNSHSVRYEYPAYQMSSAEPEPAPPVHTSSAGAQVDPGPADKSLELKFEITDLEGQVHEFATPFAAYDAFAGPFDMAAKMGVARLDGFWEDNQEFLDQLSVSGNGNLAAELAQRFTDKRDEAEKLAAERQAEAAEREERERAAREADARVVAERERQAQQQAPAATTAPQADNAPSASPGAPGAGAATEAEAAPGDRPSRKIEVPIAANGKPDYRVFAIALLGPKIRATKKSSELAWLLGDNDEALTKCREPGLLTKDDLATLESTITAQFAKLPADG